MTMRPVVTSPEPFRICVPDSVLAGIAARIRAYPWDEAAGDAALGWRYGPSSAYLRDFCRYWTEEFDWRTAEAALNRFPQVTAEVDGQRIHAWLERGSDDPGRALVLLHGWPSTFAEFSGVVERLAHPERFGGKAGDAFDVIVPSLPGYGFSGRLRAPAGPREAASRIDAFMRQGLGYDSYIAHGGDWGAEVSVWLGFDHAPACRGVHLGMRGLAGNAEPAADSTPDERAWHADAARRLAADGLYLLLQTKETQTLAYALADSPVGFAAWILDKFARWLDLPAGDPAAMERLVGRDFLITTVMLYLVTGSAASALWIYPGYETEPQYLPAGKRVEVPVGIFALPKDPIYKWPPRAVLERSYNIVRWTDPMKGAHFAALETPAALVADLQAFARLT